MNGHREVASGQQSAPDLGDPAPEQDRVSAWRQIAGLFGAPLAWFAQMSLSEPLAAQACYPHTMPLNMPQLPALLPSLPVLLTLITCAALAAAIFCSSLAWASVRKTHNRSTLPAGHTVEHGGGRAGFLATLAFMASLMFLAAILISGLAVLLVSPCSRW